MITGTATSIAGAAVVLPGAERADVRERFLHVVCILVTPFALLAINRNLFINPIGDWIDPWVYTGCFVGLPARLHLFGDTYYVTRLSWLLPGALTHSVLPPLSANYVLHVGFFYALLFATYELVSRGVDRATAILVAMAMGWSPIILSALGWDYVDGAGIVFLVATLLCLEIVVHGGRHRWAWSVAAGIGMACMASSNLFLIVMSPVCLLFFLVRLGVNRWRLIVPTLTYAAAGGISLLVVFAAVNRVLGGPWFFLAPSVDATRWVLATPSPWRQYFWHYRALWLALPVVATCGAVLDLLSSDRTGNRLAVALQVTLLAAVAVWTTFELSGIPILQFSYYTSYLAPLSLMALSLQSGFTAAASRRTSVALIIATLALLAIAHAVVLRNPPAFVSTAARIPGLRRAYEVMWFGPFSPASFATFLAVIGGLLAVLSLRFGGVEAVRWLGFVAGLSVLCVGTPQNWPQAGRGGAQASYEQIVLIDRFIERNIGQHSLRFWYDLHRTAVPSLRGIAGTYFWGYVLVNEEMPALTAAEAAGLASNTRLVFLVPRAHDVERARQSLRKYNLDFSVVAREDFGAGERALSVVLADLVRLPGDHTS